MKQRQEQQPEVGIIIAARIVRRSPLVVAKPPSSYDPTYRIWQSMKTRCLNPNTAYYRYYGGRGISVCERWMSYRLFLMDMGERPEGMSLDRIDTNGNYEPGNCRWATSKEQSVNKRNVRLYEMDGVKLCAKDWAGRKGVKYDRLRYLIKKGLDFQTALQEAAK